MPEEQMEKLGAGEALPKAALVNIGIVPRNLDEGMKLANFMATSSLVPKDFQRNPANILVAIQLGAEVGLPPMQALQSIAVINGRPSLWGDGFLALIMASPSYEDHDEYFLVAGARVDFITAEDLKADDTTSVCTFWRRNKKLPVTRSFSVAHAKKAQLWGKAGPWQTYPDRMLRMRARGFAGRDAFPDVLRGIGIAEEVIDIPDRPEITVQPITSPRRIAEGPVERMTNEGSIGTGPDRTKADTTTGELHDEPPLPTDADAPATEKPADSKPATEPSAQAQPLAEQQAEARVEQDQKKPDSYISAARVRRLYAIAKGHRTTEDLQRYVRNVTGSADAAGDPLTYIRVKDYERICEWAGGKD